MPRSPLSSDRSPPVDLAPDMPQDLPADLGAVTCARHAPMLASASARGPGYGPIRTAAHPSLTWTGQGAPIAAPPAEA